MSVYLYEERVRGEEKKKKVMGNEILKTEAGNSNLKIIFSRR